MGGPGTMGPGVMNGDSMVEGMKNSPANGGPGTPRDDSGSGMGEYNLGGFGGPQENVSRFLITIKFYFLVFIYRMKMFKYLVHNTNLL